MIESLTRIRAMIFRYLYLHKRSVSRTLELVFWPVMELLVWGFLSLYIQQSTEGSFSRIIVHLISAMIFWDILYRSQQGVSISIVEDIWTHNIMNLLVSPLKIWEWLVATFLYGLGKTLLITLILFFIALSLYHFNLIGVIGFYLIPLMVNLFLFGWAMGIFTSGLLIRWGHAVEALIWGIPFLVQPISAIFYPLSTLPPAIQTIARFLPSTYIFEGMRAVIRSGELPFHYLIMALALNLLYFFLASLFFNSMYHRSRASGRLGRLGMD